MVGNNSLPFTVYNARNADTAPAGTYLGQASKKTALSGSYDYFPHLAKTCATVFIFARIVGTRNTKITRPTTDNPYIYVSTRGYFVEKIPGYESTSILHDYDSYTATLRTITTDGSIILTENKRHDYDLQALTYDFDNVCNINGLFYRRLGVPGKSDVVWMMKDIVGSEFITVSDGDTSVNFSFNSSNFASAVNTPCVDDSRGHYEFYRWNTDLSKASCKE
jgi:hypothetical protein